MYIPLNTVRRCVSVVDALADLTDTARFADVALPQLARLIPCDVLTYNEIDVSARVVGCADLCCASGTAANPAVPDGFGREPLLERFPVADDTEALRIRDVVGRAELHRLCGSRGIRGTVPVRHRLACTVVPSAEFVVGIAFHRVDVPFADAEHAAIALLGGPMTSALRRAAQRREATASPSAGLELSTRERQVLDLVAVGRTNAAIARALAVSPRTVEKHLEHIYRKLQVADRAAAVAHAIR